MRRRPLIETASLFLLAPLVAAQVVPGDPLDRAKTAAYYHRHADEFRAREAVERARTALKTRRYKTALAQLDGADAIAQGPLHATGGRFFTAKGTSFVAVQMGVPAGAAQPGTSLTFFGEVTDAEGRVLADFELRSPVLVSKGDLFVEHSLLATENARVARVGVAAGDRVLGAAKSALVSDDAANARSSEISQLIVSNDVFNMQRPQNPFEPFAFGGTKVIPKPDRTFRPTDEAWVFVELRESDPNVALPAVAIRSTIEGMGRSVASSWQSAEVLPLRGVAGHFGIGMTVDLSALAPGNYRITLAVRDAKRKQTVERSQAISVRQ